MFHQERSKERLPEWPEPCNAGRQTEAATLTKSDLSIEPGCECDDGESRQILDHKDHANYLCATKVGSTKALLVGQVVRAAFRHLLFSLIGMLHHCHSTVNIEPKIPARQAKQSSFDLGDAPLLHKPPG